jgi:hypothetical protein
VSSSKTTLSHEGLKEPILTFSSRIDDLRFGVLGCLASQRKLPFMPSEAEVEKFDMLGHVAIVSANANRSGKEEPAILAEDGRQIRT